MVLKVVMFVFYSSLVRSLHKRDYSVFNRALEKGFFPLFLRSKIFSYLIKESLRLNFFMGAWIVLQEKDFLPEDLVLSDIESALTNLSDEEFKVLKTYLPTQDSKFYPPLGLYHKRGADLSYALFNRLNNSMESSESISLVNQGRPWNIPKNKLARCYWEYMRKYSDLGNALSIWRYLVSEKNNLAPVYFKWLELACQTYPHSVVLQTLKQRKALVSYNSFSHEEVLYTTIQELFPGITSRALRNKFLGNRSPFFTGTIFEGEGCVWQHDQLKWFNHLLLNFPHFKPDWFLEGDLEMLVHQASPGFLNTFTIIANHLKDASTTMQKSLVVALVSVDSDVLYGLERLIPETSPEVVTNMINSGEGTISTLLTKLTEYHDVRPDLQFDQHLIQSFHGKTFVFQKKTYEVVVPKVSQELIDAGKALNNCVGDGEYADQIMDNEISIFFLKTNGVITHCFEVDGFEIVEAKRKSNLEAGQRLLAKLCEELDLEDGT